MLYFLKIVVVAKPLLDAVGKTTISAFLAMFVPLY